jgi:hypothetical protein
MASSDKPKIDLILSDLENEIRKPEPFVVVLNDGKRITFKDPYDFKISEREEILAVYESARAGEADDLDLLKKIMSPADYQKYIDADLPIRTHGALVERVMGHFKGGLGDAGNGSASAS